MDKQIVSIVKETYSYDEICKHLETDISQNTYNYTISTWFNHWSTILTEHIFKRNANVLSAIGKIKSVDFFIDDIPMDLKITYFPKEYLKLRRKECGYGNEISTLKKFARSKQIDFDAKEKDEVLKYQITEQIKDLNCNEGNKLLKQIANENNSIIDETIKNKNDLMRWLYENQGEMRFGSENRLFLIFIDKSDLTHSWKLKRNFKLQKAYIENYLDNFSADTIKANEIKFIYKGQKYRTLADALFIVV